MLLFRKVHRDTILAGVKTATRRNWEKRRALVGAVHQCRLELFGEPFARVLVESVYQQALGAMTEADAQREGGYTLAEFRELWEAMNGSWDPDLVVWVVEFSRIRRSEEAELLREQLEAGR